MPNALNLWRQSLLNAPFESKRPSELLLSCEQFAQLAAFNMRHSERYKWLSHTYCSARDSWAPLLVCRIGVSKPECRLLLPFVCPSVAQMANFGLSKLLRWSRCSRSSNLEFVRIKRNDDSFLPNFWWARRDHHPNRCKRVHNLDIFAERSLITV